MMMCQITMQLPVVFLAVLAASWVQGGEANQCNKTIIGLIKTFNENSQLHILATNFKRSPTWVAYTTEDFFPNEKDYFSVVTDWAANGEITYYIYFKEDIAPTTAHSGPLEEKDGSTYDKATKTFRWHVHMTGLVDAFYKCEENGKEGPPEAMVQVWRGFKVEDKEKAKEQMEMLLGCKLSVKYDSV